MLDYQCVKNWSFPEVVQSYGIRDTMLYALGLGMGTDPLNEAELAFVYEDRLQVVPTMAAVLGSPGPWMRDPRSGIDYSKLVHGEQAVKICKPLPAATIVVATNCVVSVTDKGAGKGAILVVVRELREQGYDELLAECRQTYFLRADGGFSANGSPSDPGPASLPSVPERAPDVELSLATLPGQALIYRLSGDYNPLHADPAVAKAAGFDRPILHGLCTYGVAARALLKAAGARLAEQLREIAVRFTAPVYPGEILRFECWHQGGGEWRLRAHVDARGAVVLNNGLARLE